MATNSLEPGQFEIADFLPPGVEPSLGDLGAALAYTQSDVANLQGDVNSVKAWKASLTAVPYTQVRRWDEIKIWRPPLPPIPSLGITRGVIPGTELILQPGQVPPNPFEFLTKLLFPTPPVVPEELIESVLISKGLSDKDIASFMKEPDVDDLIETKGFLTGIELDSILTAKNYVMGGELTTELEAPTRLKVHEFLDYVPIAEIGASLDTNNIFSNNIADELEWVNSQALGLADDVASLRNAVSGLEVAVGEGITWDIMMTEVNYVYDGLNAKIAGLQATIEAAAVLPTTKSGWLDLAGLQSAVADLIPPGLSLPTTPTGWMDLPGFPILPTDFPTLEDIRAEIAAQIEGITVPDFPTLEDIRAEIEAQMVEIPGISSIIDYATDLDSVLISGGGLLKSAGANLTKVNTDSLSNMDLAGDSIQAVIDEYEAIEFPASFIGDNLIHAINMVVNLVNAVGYLGSVVNTIRGGFDVVGSDIGGVGALLENVPEPPLLPTLL